MPGLRFGVLGALEVLADGQRLTVPAGRRRAVLACLLVRRGEVVHPDALVEAAWGDCVPSDPRAALHTVVSRLRSLLGGEAIVSSPRGYRLSVGLNAVDADVFADLLAQARTASPPRASVLLDQALHLWHGPAFDEFADAAFARPEAVRLEGLRREAQERLAAALIDTREFGAGIPVLDDLLTAEPYRESALELLMLALYRSGRQAEALERYREHRERLVEDLGLDPAPALVELEARILGHVVASAVDRDEPPTWLDTSAPLIGREDDLAALLTAVEANRVTVITGPGGVGKTRLAAQALPQLHASVGAAVVVPLATRNPGDVAHALAEALGLRATGPALEHIVGHLGTTPYLLLFDNCEHLLDEVTDIVARVALRCRGTKVLCTSRRRLGIHSEAVLPLSPLPVPTKQDNDPWQVEVSPAVRLFTDRVRRLRPGFSVNAYTGPDVAELCRRLDGLPLALELAASRTAASSPSEVLARSPADRPLSDDADLDEMIGWSVRLLAPEQQTMLAVLSTFSGEFTSQAVRAVVAPVLGGIGDTDAVLAELVESSLVVRDDTHSSARYRLLAVIRQYANTLLVESGAAEPAQRSHAEWVADLTERIGVETSGVDGESVRRRLDEMILEIVSAVRWALARRDLRLAARITEAVGRHLHWIPPQQLSDLVVDVATEATFEASPALAGAVGAGAVVVAERGDLVRARRLAGAALRMAGEADRPATACLALALVGIYSGKHESAARWYDRMATEPSLRGEASASLGLLACYADDLDAAREHVSVALAAGPSGPEPFHAFARYAAGEVEARRDPVHAIELLRGAAAQADRVGAHQVSKVARVALLALLIRGGEHRDAITLARGLLTDLSRWGAWAQLWTTVRILAELAALDRPADAVLLLGAARTAPAAPPLVGADIARYAELDDRLIESLGTGVVHRIQSLTPSLSDREIVRRAQRLLDELDP